MSHSMFQRTQIMPAHNTVLPVPLLPTTTVFRSVVWPPVACKIRKCCLTVKASSSAVVDGDAIASLERCFRALSLTSSGSGDFGPVMKGQYGAVTFEKSKLDLTSEQTTESDNMLDLDYGGGDKGGKDLSNGSGNGGADGGDDDDYFHNFDEGDEGDEGGLFRRRIILPELFDREFVDAVLKEWQMTVKDLPDGLRQAYEWCSVSSAQMTRFVANNARPTTARFIARSLSQGISRAFIGRMIADPSFLYKLLLEQATTIGCSVWSEINNRRERIKQEWDLALINILTVTA